MSGGDQDLPPARGVASVLDAERGRLFLWSPACIAAGSGVYLSLDFEPSSLSVVAACTVAFALFLLVRRTKAFVPAVMIACVVAGAGLAKVRVETLHNPPITHRTGVVDVAGWIEDTVPLASGRRVILRVGSISGFASAAWPRNVRLNVYGGTETLLTGQAIVVRTRLEPVPGPVEPGGFDFGRRAWFLGIGGIGQVFGAVDTDEDAGPPPWDIRARALADGLRLAIAARVGVVLDGRESGFLTAVTTGRRGGLDADVVDDLRAAGLAHLLAISGLHMALIAGTAFWALRALLAFSSVLALRHPIKKWAALAALATAAVYLALSGASVSTQRAFIMVAIMFLAILADRPAISIRNVAVAALAILIFRPESAVDVSFQMSFMTVTVLVAFYEWRLSVRDADAARFAAGRGRARHMLRKTTAYVSGVALTTVLAGVATGPIAAYHFSTVAAYGVVGNLIAVPLMGLAVMPLGLAAVFAMPFGLEAYFLRAAGLFVSMILDTAHWVATLPGSVQTVSPPSTAGVLAVVAGMLVMCLVRSRWRMAGAAIILAAAVPGGTGSAALVLVEREGKVAAVRNEQGLLVLTSARAGRFAAERWLKADGDAAEPSDAASRNGLACDSAACVARTPSGIAVAWVRTPEALWDECREADVVVASFPIGTGCGGPRVVIDWWDIYRGGAHGVYEIDGTLVVHAANALRGMRPWVPSDGRVSADADDAVIQASENE